MTTIITWLTHKQVPCWNFSEKEQHLLARLLPSADVRICRSKEAFLKELPAAEVALVWRFDQEFFEHAPNLRWLATPAAGMDYFEINPPNGLTVSYGKFHGQLIAETVAGMVLGHCRGIIDSVILTQESPWPRAELGRSMISLRGAHVVILGFGHIGQWIGRLLKPFGVRISGVRQTVPEILPDYFEEADQVLPVSQLDDILPETDHLVICLPKTAATDNIIDESRLALLAPHAAVYNVGRGNAIDERALFEALEAGKLSRACLDVFQEEPLPDNSPLRRHPKVFIMPHATAISPDYMQLFCREVAEEFAEIIS